MDYGENHQTRMSSPGYVRTMAQRIQNSALSMVMGRSREMNSSVHVTKSSPQPRLRHWLTDITNELQNRTERTQSRDLSDETQTASCIRYRTAPRARSLETYQTRHRLWAAYEGWHRDINTANRTLKVVLHDFPGSFTVQKPFGLFNMTFQHPYSISWHSRPGKFKIPWISWI